MAGSGGNERRKRAAKAPSQGSGGTATVGASGASGTGDAAGGGGGGGGSGGGGSGGGGECPDTVPATLIGPASGVCVVGDFLDVRLVTTPSPPRIVCVLRATGQTVGAIGGIPGLGRLLECLEAGVVYEASVDAVSGGRIDVVLRRT